MAVAPITPATALAAAWLLAAAAAAAAQGQVERYRAEFQQERDAVRRARAMPKFGDALLELARQRADGEQFAEALAAVEEFRGALQTTHAALKASGINAEKRPNGFKQLEIHVRKSLRALDDIVAALPLGQRVPFEAVRRQVEVIDKELIALLFPRQPGRTPEKKPGAIR